MVQNHLTRLTAPVSWPIKRKQNKWITRPKNGTHSLEKSIPLSVVLREMLGYAKTIKEVKHILNNGWVLINGVVKKTKNTPVGFMDLVEINKTKEHFRMLYTKKGKFTLVPVSKGEENLKLYRVLGKTVIKKGKMQINLSCGHNLLLDKFQGKTGDAVLVDLSKKVIKEHVSLDKGVMIYLTGGKHVGHLGKVKEILNTKGLQKNKLIYEADGIDYETSKEYAFVVGKTKSLVKLEQ